MPLMTVNAKLELEFGIEERPFEHVSKGELVRGFEVRDKLATEIPAGVELTRDPIPDRPRLYRIEAGVLWHRDEERFYRIEECSLAVSSPGMVVQQGGWLAALCWRVAPGGSQYPPKFRKGARGTAATPAEAFVSLADGWSWPKVVQAFGPKKKADVDERPIAALYRGAADAIEVEYDELDDRQKVDYLTRVARGGLLGEWFAPEHATSSRAELIFRDGLGSRMIGAAQDFKSMRDEWQRLRPETVLKHNAKAPASGRKGE